MKVFGMNRFLLMYWQLGFHEKSCFDTFSEFKRKLKHVGYGQGDQIGRVFAYWATVFFGQFFLKNTIAAHSFCQLFSTVKYVVIFTKMVWATFWATF
jgi:hypothetical protein